MAEERSVFAIHLVSGNVVGYYADAEEAWSAWGDCEDIAVAEWDDTKRGQPGWLIDHPRPQTTEVHVNA